MNGSSALFRTRSIRLLWVAVAALAAALVGEGEARAGDVTVLSAGAPSPQSSGVPFTVTVRMQSSGASSNVCATLFTGASGGTVTVVRPTTKCAGNLVDGQIALLTWQVTFALFSGQTTGQVNFVASVTWGEGSVTFAGAPVNVIPAAAPAQLAVTAVSPSRTTVFSNEDLAVDVVVRNSAIAGSDSASIGTVTLLESNGGGNPACGTGVPDGSGTLAPQTDRTFRFTCRSSVSGSFRLSGRVTGTDATTGQALTGGPLLSVPITVNSPAAGLLVTSVAPTPLAVRDDEAIVVDVFVKNTALVGGHDATGVSTALQASAPTSGSGGAADCAQTSAPDATPLSPQAQRRISFACVGTGHGTFAFRADASGSDGGISLSASGSSAEVTVTDDRSPTVAISPSPVPWSAADLTFELTATDQVRGAGVASVTVQIDGGPLTVTAGANVSVSLTAEAQHIVMYFATDRAGNNSATSAVTAGIDRTAPGIAGGQSPPATDGWNNSAVTVSFTCDDALSGVATCSGPVTLAAETAGTMVPGTAVDRAGNSGSTSWGPVRIDLTPPIISGAALEPGNAAGWYRQPVTVRFTCTDALSGVASCPVDVVLAGEGSGQSTSGTARDRAGNTAAATVSGIDVDLTPPEISATRTPVANAEGWSNGDVTVTFTCTDALSGVASCPGPATVAGEGANQAASGTAVDQAGNSGSARLDGISIDRTPPTIEVSTAPSPNAAGWNNSAVTASFTCADALSGVAAQACPAPQSFEGDGRFTATGSVVDHAGNTTSGSATVNVDRTAPVVQGNRTPPNGFGWNNGPVTVAFTCTDALSGVASCTAPRTLGGEGAAQSASGEGTDVAGNSASATVGDINIDLGAPVIHADRGPTMNLLGWSNQPVVVHFTCADTLSGIDVCPRDLLFAADGQFPLAGTTRDRAGNTGYYIDLLPISVDLTPPSVSVPSVPVVAEAVAPAGAPVSFAASASDLTSGYLPGSLGCSSVAGVVVPGAVFAVGDTAVTCAAVDLAGNVGSASFTVSVRDTIAPSLPAVADLVAEATSPGGVAVTFTPPTASDLVDGTVAVTCDHRSGEVFPIGTTVVHCSASDGRGNAAATSFQIVVRSVVPPTIGKVSGTNDRNELIAFATSIQGAVVSYTVPRATDSRGNTVPVSCAPVPGTRFALGKTTVTCTAVDSAGQRGTATFTVWVQVQAAFDASTGSIFRQPVNPDGSSIFRIGSVVAVRFRLGGASAGITNLVAKVSMTNTSSTILGTQMESYCSDGADSSDRFRYESKDNHYENNRATKYLSQGTYLVKADLGDGVSRTVRISLRR
jgi:hypothetical protein